MAALKEGRWDQLCLQAESAVAVAETIGAVLAQGGYAPYDPFPGGAGTPATFKKFVRLFILPEAEGWLRVLGAQDAALLPEMLRKLSAGRTVLHAWFTAERGALEAYRDGRAEAALLAAYLGESASAAAPESQPRASNLPSEVAKLAEAQGVDPKQAERLIGRFAGRLFGAGAAGVQAEAARLFQSAWQSAGGQQLAAQIGRLRLPFDLRTPDFETLREAYHAQRLLARRPSARLMESERAALQALPNVGAVQPIYMGKA